MITVYKPYSYLYGAGFEKLKVVRNFCETHFDKNYNLRIIPIKCVTQGRGNFVSGTKKVIRKSSKKRYFCDKCFANHLKEVHNIANHFSKVICNYPKSNSLLRCDTAYFQHCKVQTLPRYMNNSLGLTATQVYE